MHRNPLPKPESKILLKMSNDILGLNFLLRYKSSNWANICNSCPEVERSSAGAMEAGGPGQVTLKG